MKKWLLLIGLISLNTTAFADKLDESNENYIRKDPISVKKYVFAAHQELDNGQKIILNFIAGKADNNDIAIHKKKILETTDVSYYNIFDPYPSCRDALFNIKQIWGYESIGARFTAQGIIEEEKKWKVIIENAFNTYQNNLTLCKSQLLNTTET